MHPIQFPRAPILAGCNAGIRTLNNFWFSVHANARVSTKKQSETYSCQNVPMFKIWKGTRPSFRSSFFLIPRVLRGAQRGIFHSRPNNHFWAPHTNHPSVISESTTMKKRHTVTALLFTYEVPMPRKWWLVSEHLSITRGEGHMFMQPILSWIEEGK